MMPFLIGLNKLVGVQISARGGASMPAKKKHKKNRCMQKYLLTPVF